LRKEAQMRCLWLRRTTAIAIVNVRREERGERRGERRGEGEGEGERRGEGEGEGEGEGRGEGEGERGRGEGVGEGRRTTAIAVAKILRREERESTNVHR
jgi:hypothetical protein